MQLVRVIVASITLTVAASGCVGTELNVPSSHPGSASARVGRLQDLTAFRLDFAAAANASASGGHAHGAQGTRAEAAASDGPHGGAAHTHGVDASEAAHQGAGAPAVAGFTCPMHPEVQRGEPGKCPKCGMNLVPKKERK